MAVWRSFLAVEWDTCLGSSIPTHFLEAVAPCLPGSCCTCCMSCNGKIKTHQKSAYKNLISILVEYNRMQFKFKRYISSSSRKQNGAYRAVWLRWIAPPSGWKWLLIIYIVSLNTDLPHFVHFMSELHILTSEYAAMSYHSKIDQKSSHLSAPIKNSRWAGMIDSFELHDINWNLLRAPPLPQSHIY